MLVINKLKIKLINLIKIRVVYLLQALVLSLFMLTLNAGAPHTVGGSVTYSGGGSPSSATFSAYITSRPGEELTQSSAGCGYGSGSYWIQCGNFPTSWVAGEILHVDLSDGLSGNASDEVVLTANPADQLNLVIIDTIPLISVLHINEFCTANNNIIADQHGNYDDWIEIYNSTDEPVNIGGMYITDSLYDPTKYRIPSTYPDSTTIPAKGYLILWADNQVEQGLLHLGFRLGRDGEQIGLVDTNGIGYIDSLTYGEQYSNSSISRYPDGNDSWIYPPPTPGSTNTLPVISGLYINEFSTSNLNIITDEHGDYDDWIEIYNSTDEPVNIGGLFITDSLDDPRKHRIPSTYPDSTTIPAHGYIILWGDNQEDQGVLHIDFKLTRSGEQIGLAGYDGTNYIDSLTYGEQYQNSSASRYPDANNTWIYPPPTPGSTNILPIATGLYINEFSASNSNIIADENGEYDDWIEIFNSTNEPVNIGGFFITDSLAVPVNHRIPSTYPDSTTIPANGYIILWADNQQEQGVLHLGFKLGRNGEQIGLAGYNGMYYIDSLNYGEQYVNSSASRYPDGNDSWIYPPPSPGSKNESFKTEGLYINEFCAANSTIIADQHGEYDDWIEIYNSTNNPADIGGLFITDNLDDPGKHRIPTTYPDSTTIPANGYILLWADNQDEQGVLHLGFGLSREGDAIGLAVLQADNFTFIDSIRYNFEMTNNKSYGKNPDGTGNWTILDIPTPYESNIITSIDDNYSIRYELHQNMPNPFNRETTIEYYLPGNEFVSIEIYNLAGEKVKTLLQGKQTGGKNHIRWNATNDFGKIVPSGVYICTMTTRTYRASKMVIFY